MCAPCIKNLGPNKGVLLPAFDVIMMVELHHILWEEFPRTCHFPQ